MQLDFYTTSSEKNRLVKNLSALQTMTGHLVEMCDVVNPTIKVGFTSSLLTKNYVYIPAFERYYFINSMQIENKEIIVNLHVDVLMTYAQQIKNSNAHIIRSASNYDEFIIDEMIINKANTRTYQRKLGAGFTKADKYLVLIGG